MHILTVDNAGNKTETVKGPITVEKVMAKVGEIVTGENKEYEKNGTAIIPVGFAIKPGCDDIANGLVISDVANDENDTGNQFVWVPVPNIESYKSWVPVYNPIGMTRGPWELPSRLPSGITSEEEVIAKAGGFYIARYETGVGVVSKKGMRPQTSIYQNDAVNNAKKFIDNDFVKSGIVTCKQWDSTMSFVNGKTDGRGNIFNVNSYSNSRHTGNIANTGYNLADKVLNIFDLEGNATEISSERCQYDNMQLLISRGGFETLNLEYNPACASAREPLCDYTANNVGYRMVLYVMS